MLDLKLNFLKNHLENNLLLINSNESAFSISANIREDKIQFDILLNNVDSEIKVISTFIKLYNDYLLMHGYTFIFCYHILVNTVEAEIKEINILIYLK